MKTKILFTILLVIIISIVSCGGSKESTEINMSISIKSDHTAMQYRISFLNGKGYNAPTFVLWSEDMNGAYLKTHYITKYYASGVFGHEKINDSTWKPVPGPSYQPAALPYWTYRKGLINNETLIPTPENPFIDACTGATPEQNFEIILPKKNKNAFRLLFEVNQTGDWNSYWTNNKYPESSAYKNSAQPSVIYAVIIDEDMNEFTLNPIGHGDPKGESGKLFTDLSSLTTAKDIFKSIKIERIVK
jgi:hypothetical protein